MVEDLTSLKAQINSETMMSPGDDDERLVHLEPIVNVPDGLTTVARCRPNVRRVLLGLCVLIRRTNTRRWFVTRYLAADVDH